MAFGVASCRELGIVADVVFPSAVPGLPSDQNWESLPLRRWLTEPGIEPVAISACFTCAEPAVAGLFRAQGDRANALRQALRDPAALFAAPRKAGSRLRARAKSAEARISAEPAQEGGAAGFVVRIARLGGKRSAAGYVAAAERGGLTSILIIVASSEASARAIARSVVPRLRD